MKCNEKKKAVVSDYLKGEDAIREIAKKHGVSKSTVANWLNEYASENPAVQKEIEEIKLDHVIEGCISGGKESSRSNSVNKDSKIAKKLFGGRKVTRGTIYGELIIDTKENRKGNISSELSSLGEAIAKKFFGGRKVIRGSIEGKANFQKRRNLE